MTFPHLLITLNDLFDAIIILWTGRKSTLWKNKNSTDSRNTFEYYDNRTSWKLDQLNNYIFWKISRCQINLHIYYFDVNLIYYVIVRVTKQLIGNWVIGVFCKKTQLPNFPKYFEPISSNWVHEYRFQFQIKNAVQIWRWIWI